MAMIVVLALFHHFIFRCAIIKRLIRCKHVSRFLVTHLPVHLRSQPFFVATWNLVYSILVYIEFTSPLCCCICYCQQTREILQNCWKISHQSAHKKLHSFNKFMVLFFTHSVCVFYSLSRWLLRYRGTLGSQEIY